MVISMIVPVAVKMTKTKMVDNQVACFLEGANRDFFGPRGLVVLISTLSRREGEIVSYDMRNGNGIDGRMASGQFTLPPSEELIYLDDDEVVGQQKGVGGFIGDYYDRRSQAQYVSLTFLPYAFL